jgi:DNA-binding Xre family transcriptional regulator
MGTFECRLRVLVAEWELKHDETMSWAELSRRIGVSHATLIRYGMDETQRYDRDVLAKLCEFLDCGIEELLVYQPDSDPSAA